MSAIENAFNVPEMKYNADTLRCGSLEPRGGGRGGGRSAINRRSVERTCRGNCGRGKLRYV